LVSARIEARDRSLFGLFVKSNNPAKENEMTFTKLAIAAAAGAALTAPALAHDRDYDDPVVQAAQEADTTILIRGSQLPISPNNDSNKFWLDYTTDISEAARELKSDLARATDEEDRREARAEYVREVRDAQKDYAEEMSERGYRVASFEVNSSVLASAY